MPRKLGQHFLVRDSVLEKLANAACGVHAERVIEIGSGRGALTRHLLPLTDELHAIELDAALARHLESKYSAESKLHVHNADVLATDLSRWGAAVLAGNLPYYITSPIIERFLSLPAEFARAVFLVQWEVAQRLQASPGSRDYGYLTVITQFVCEVRLIVRVPAAAFHPPPKVDSGAVELRRKTAVPANLGLLRTFASRCFAHKRKTLRNNLRPFYGEAIDAMPEAGLRAEQLSTDALIDLFEKLQPTQLSGPPSVN